MLMNLHEAGYQHKLFSASEKFAWNRIAGLVALVPVLDSQEHFGWSPKESTGLLMFRCKSYSLLVLISSLRGKPLEKNWRINKV